MRFFVAEAENRPKSAHRYNVAEQQLIYKSEIERIWKAQFASLSRKDEPQLSDDEDDNKSQPALRATRRENRAHSPIVALTGGPAAAASPGLSRASSIERDRDVSVGPDGGRRVLRIKRYIDGKWSTEIVRDAAVIRAYVRRRQIIEDETTGADTLAPTGDSDRDARAKKRWVLPTPPPLFFFPANVFMFMRRLEEEIARMKKNQERRLHRKNAKIAKEGGTLMTLNRPIKPDTTVRPDVLSSPLPPSYPLFFFFLFYFYFLWHRGHFDPFFRHPPFFFSSLFAPLKPLDPAHLTDD